MKKREYISPTVGVEEMEVEVLLTTFSTSSDVEGAVGAKPHGLKPAPPHAEPNTFSLWDEGE